MLFTGFLSSWMALLSQAAGDGLFMLVMCVVQSTCDFNVSTTS
jgi:hypothetical protein